jgi:hypothetical protein
MAFAAGQLAVFQGASDEHILIDTQAASNAEKPPTGRGPEGCDENGPAAALLVGHVSFRYAPLLAPCRRRILIATKAMLFRGQDTGATAARRYRVIVDEIAWDWAVEDADRN